MFQLNSDASSDTGHGVLLGKVDKFCYICWMQHRGCDSAVMARVTAALKRSVEYLPALMRNGFSLKFKV